MSTPHPEEQNPHMPHSAPPVQALANTEAAQRARHQATVVTCAAATVPTVLAMQGFCHQPFSRTLSSISNTIGVKETTS